MIPATLCALVAIGLAFRMPSGWKFGLVAGYVYVRWLAENWRASKEGL